MATLSELIPPFSSRPDSVTLGMVLAIRESRRTMKENPRRKKRSAGQKKAVAKRKAEVKLSPQQMFKLLTPEERAALLEEYLDD